MECYVFGGGCFERLTGRRELRYRRVIRKYVIGYVTADGVRVPSVISYNLTIKTTGDTVSCTVLRISGHVRCTIHEN